jgi:RimK family alpha-L-glutamate ligase
VNAQRIAIVGSADNETNPDLVERWRELGLDVALLSPHDALLQLRAGDVAIGRVDVRRSFVDVEPGLLELWDLGRRGVRVVNDAKALLNAHDKLRTTTLLAAAGLEQPRSEHVRLGGRPSLPPPLVVKPRFGSWGIDVFRCDDDADVRRVFAEISGRPWFRRHGALVQELLPPCGYDVRILVAAGEVVGANERVAAPGEWRTNISLGGSERPAASNSLAFSLATAAVAAVGGELFGVDLMPVETGYVALEINAAVDFDQDYSIGGDVYADAAGALGLIELTARARATATSFHP